MTREEAISINSMVETIATKVTEDTEKFIFETIKPYCEEITKREISKKDLERALTQYFSKEPCDDAISREAVKEQIKCWIGSGEYRYTNATEYLIRRINNMPSVHPSHKGHWTSTVCYARTDNGVLLMGFECSECGKITFISPAMHTPKGCPFCMADMRGDT